MPGYLDYLYSIGLSEEECNTLLYVKDEDRPDLPTWHKELERLYIDVLGYSDRDAQVFAYDENKVEYWEWYQRPIRRILNGFRDVFESELEIWNKTPEQITKDWEKMEGRHLSSENRKAMEVYWKIWLIQLKPYLKGVIFE